MTDTHNPKQIVINCNKEFITELDIRKLQEQLESIFLVWFEVRLEDETIYLDYPKV